jgi:hypothetical protein
MTSGCGIVCIIAVVELGGFSLGHAPPPAQKKTSLYTFMLDLFFATKQLKVMRFAPLPSHVFGSSSVVVK